VLAVGVRLLLDEDEHRPPVHAVGRAVHRLLGAGGDDVLARIARPVPVCADESVRDRASLAAIADRYDAVFGRMVNQVFDLFDADDDGQITLAEYRLWLTAQGVPADLADEAFYKLESEGVIEFDMAKLSERLGRPIDTDIFLVNMSSYYGRMVVSDGMVAIHSDIQPERFRD